MLNACKESAEFISSTAMGIVNASPAILLDLCDQLSALLEGRVPAENPSPRPPLSVRRKLVDDAVAAARRRVEEEKDSMEACATKCIIDRNQLDGLLRSLKERSQVK